MTFPKDSRKLFRARKILKKEKILEGEKGGHVGKGSTRNLSNR